MLVRLIYYSHRDPKMGSETIAAILKTAIEFNSAHKLSGVLVVGPGHFLQVLEGHRKTVSELYARIIADRRHRAVILVSVNETDMRVFGDWDMALLDDHTIASLAMGIGGMKYEPWSMSAQQIEEYLVNLRSVMDAVVPKRGGEHANLN